MDAPLFVTDDPTLLDELQRLAAAAGVTPVLARDEADALRAWTAAPLVLVGVDMARALARLAPPRRAGVHVVGWGGVPDDVFRTALALGAENVAELPRSAGWLTELMADVGDTPPLGSVTLGVIGGSGGAGATTFACALGQMAARSGPAVVIDADPLGPGVDRVLGLDGHDGVRWDALCQTTGRFSGRSLRDSLPRRDQLGVLTWYPGPQGSLQAFAVRNALAAAQRGHDTVVLDLPRTVDPLVEELVARCDRVFVVAVPTVAGLASAVRLCARFRDPSPLRLVVRGDHVRADAVARLVSVPVAAQMSDQRGLEEAIDLGLGPVRSRRGPLGRTAWRAGRPGGAAARGMSAAARAGASSGAVVDEVRERLAHRPGELTAHRVAEALRATGRPVGDATVLAVHEELRRDVLGAGPLEPLLRLPGVTDVVVNGTEGVYVDTGEGLRAGRRPVRRRGRRTPPRPAAGGARRSAPRRREPVRRRPAGRRHPLPRPARADRPARAR